MTGRLGSIVVGVVLVGLFFGAATINAQAWLMGHPASTANLVGTLTALVAWPAYGVWVGSTQRGRAHSWRFPVVFWSAVVVLAVGGWLLLTEGPATTVSGGISLIAGTAVFLGTAPFYGLTRLVDLDGPLTLAVGTSVAVLTVTLLATSLARRQHQR